MNPMLRTVLGVIVVVAVFGAVILLFRWYIDFLYKTKTKNVWKKLPHLSDDKLIQQYNQFKKAAASHSSKGATVMLFGLGGKRVTQYYKDIYERTLEEMTKRNLETD